MRRSVRIGATIALVAILLVSVARLKRDALRVSYHRLALKRVERGLFYQMNPPKTLLQWLFASLAEPWRSPALWEKFRHHEDALVRLGYLARHEFSFTNRTLNTWQLMTNAQRRFASRATWLRVLTNGQTLSPTAISTASVVQVTAPRHEAEQWRALVHEFDQIAPENQ